MIYIVHGEDFVKSRALIINQQKKLNIQIKIELDITETNPHQLEEHLSAPSLFGEFPFVILDITNAGRQNVDEYIEIAKKSVKENVLVILSGKTLSKSNAFIKSAPTLNAVIREHTKEPEDNVFKFLDQLTEKNRKGTYIELNKLLKNDQNEVYLVSMIQYCIRNIALAKFKSPLLSKMAPFIKNKVMKYQQKFSENQILELYNFIYKMDKEIKLGETPVDTVIPRIIERVLKC